MLSLPWDFTLNPEDPAKSHRQKTFFFSAFNLLFQSHLLLHRRIIRESECHLIILISGPRWLIVYWARMMYWALSQAILHTFSYLILRETLWDRYKEPNFKIRRWRPFGELRVQSTQGQHLGQGQAQGWVQPGLTVSSPSPLYCWIPLTWPTISWSHSSFMCFAGML